MPKAKNYKSWQHMPGVLIVSYEDGWTLVSKVGLNDVTALVTNVLPQGHDGAEQVGDARVRDDVLDGSGSRDHHRRGSGRWGRLPSTARLADGGRSGSPGRGHGC